MDRKRALELVVAAACCSAGTQLNCYGHCPLCTGPDMVDCDGVGEEELREAAELLLKRLEDRTAPTAWIRVEDRLPEDEGFVLVCVTGHWKNIWFRNAIEKADYSRTEGWILETYPEWEDPGVTHWMLLPEAPEEEI